jgi:O-antigen ligase
MLLATSRLFSGAKQLMSIGLLCLVLAAIALSGSVTSFVASITGLVIWLAGGHASLRRLASVAGILGLMGVALVAINNVGASSVLSPSDRFAQTLGLQSASIASGIQRLNIDALAWDAIVRSPLLGVGLDQLSVTEALGGGSAAHNMFLFVWVGAGSIGFVGLVMMIGALGHTYIREYKKAPSDAQRLMVFALGSSFIGMLVVTSAQPELYIRHGWVPAALILAVRAIRLRDVKGTELRP